MQAHPLSSPAARIPSISSPTSSPAPHRTSSHAASRRPPSPTPASTPIFASAAGLAHDARNLLGALGLYCDLLSVPGVLRPEHRHYATELSLISNRSSELLRRLLAVPSATTPPFTSTLTHPAPTQDHACALHTLTPVLERIAAGAATVSVICPPSLPPLDFPSEVIERITINLVRNAVQAIRSNAHSQRSNACTHSSSHAAVDVPHGKIHITLAVLSSRLQLTVEDNGPGMPPAVASAFLQPSPLPRGATRGLGHRIIHELVTASAGQLSIRVRPGKGTAFCLKWPIPGQNHSTLSVKTPQQGSSTC